MTLKLIKQEVGPWPMNTYVLIDPESNASAIIDPGADADKILALTAGTQVMAIFITHGHADHVGVLAEVKAASHAPVYMNPIDAEGFKIKFDQPLYHHQQVAVGNQQLHAIHTPGHTPGLTCLDLGDGRILVGDTIFVGGPGKTWSPDDFATTMQTMQQIVFTWPDETRFFPGHGPSGTIGEERPAFDAFVARGWKRKLHGDVTWK
jgi:glyoxylase-like metal-dependent hydrolase (beta-lactamase superfamily II)